MIDRDTRAFDGYMAALGMPKDTDGGEGRARQRAMQEGLKAAVQVPLEVMRIADRAWDAMVEMAAHGNPASRSDLEVGAKALETGIWGASRNVAINLPGIEDEAYRTSGRRRGRGTRRPGGREARRGPVGLRGRQGVDLARPVSESGPRGVEMNRSVFRVPKMDCAAEEQLVRMALEGARGPGPVLRPGRADRCRSGTRARRASSRRGSTRWPSARSLSETAAAPSSRPRRPAPPRRRAGGPDPLGPPGDQRRRCSSWRWSRPGSPSRRASWPTLSTCSPTPRVYGVALYAVGRAAVLKRRAAHLMGWLQVVLALGVLGEVVRRLRVRQRPRGALHDGDRPPGPGRQRGLPVPDRAEPALRRSHDGGLHLLGQRRDRQRRGSRSPRASWPGPAPTCRISSSAR